MRREFRMEPDLEGAGIVLRVPFIDQTTYYRYGLEPEVVEVVVPLREFLEQVLSNVDAYLWGRGEVRLRLGSAPLSWCFEGVPDEVTVEREVDDDD